MLWRDLFIVGSISIVLNIMWSPLSAVTGCTDERETDDLEKAKREVIAFRARVKELNNQIKDERQKAAERIRTLENKANGDIISGVPEKAQRGRSADLNSVASDEIIGLRKKIDQLMLIKAASEFRILELEGKAKKYKSKLSTLLRERNDNMSTAGSIISKESKMLLSSSGKQLVPPPPMTSMLMKEEMEEDDDDEVIKPTVGKDGLDTEAEVATLVLSRIRQLDGEIDDIRAALANVLDERDDYRKMKAELEYARDQMETRIPQLEEDLVNCNMQLDRERVTVANMRKMILAEKAAVAKAQLGYDEVALKLEENNKMFQRFKNERDEFADETSALEETLSQLRSQTTATKAGGKVEEGKLTQQLMMVLEEKERVQTERSMLLSELKASKDEIKSVSSITADLGRQLVEREADLTALKGENERLAVACSTVQSATEIAQKELLMLKAKVTTTEIAHSKNR